MRTGKRLTEMTRLRSQVASLTRRLHDRERFTQITVGPAGRGTALYALDGLGQVWLRDFWGGRWLMLETKRAPKGAVMTPRPPAAGPTSQEESAS